MPPAATGGCDAIPYTLDLDGFVAIFVIRSECADALLEGPGLTWGGENTVLGIHPEIVPDAFFDIQETQAHTGEVAGRYAEFFDAADPAKDGPAGGLALELLPLVGVRGFEAFVLDLPFACEEVEITGFA